MNIFSLPLSNIRRKPARTLLLILVFSLGIMSIVALHQVSLIVGESLEKKLNAYGANIIISPRAEKLSVSYGGFHMGDMLYDVGNLMEKQTIEAIRSIDLKDRISAVAPKLVSSVEISGVPAAVVGVRWSEELGIKSYWAVDGRLPEREGEVLLGSQVSNHLGIGIGEGISIANGEYHVAGILKDTGGDDDRAVFMGLSALQQLLHRPDSVSFVEVAALCSGCPIEDIVSQLRGTLPTADIKALQSIVNQRMESVHFVQKLAFSISIVILITAAAMVALSMLSAVNERTKDIGILRSLGFAKAKIFTIFCIEAGLIGFASGVLGYLGGYGASFKALEILALSADFTPVFSIAGLAGTGGLFVLITVTAALYPAWKGAAIEPSVALTSI